MGFVFVRSQVVSMVIWRVLEPLHWNDFCLSVTVAEILGGRRVEYETPSLSYDADVFKDWVMSLLFYNLDLTLYAVTYTNIPLIPCR